MDIDRDALIELAHEAVRNAKENESSIEAIIDAILDKYELKGK